MKQFLQIIIFLYTYFILHNVFAGNNDGDDTFNSNQIHDIYITFSQANFWDSLTYYYNQRKTNNITTYMNAKVKINALTLHDVGVRLKGNSSYSAPTSDYKKPFKIDFDVFKPGQDFDGLERLNFSNSMKDPTMLREKIFFDFLRMQGLKAPRCTFARVYMNDTYWGFYVMVEQIDDNYLDDNFGNEAGNLFKGDSRGTLEWKGTDQQLYKGSYELNTNEDENNWSDLINLIDVINNSSPVDLKNKLEEVLNTPTYLKTWAAHNLFANLDSYIGSGHNYYIYHDTNNDKFEWISWDCNETFGNFGMDGMYGTALETLSVYFIPKYPQIRPLTQKMLENTEYKTEYTNVIHQNLLNDFTAEKLFPIIDSLANWIRADVYADTAKMYSNQDFEKNIDQAIQVGTGPGGGGIPGLKSFITNRIKSVEKQLIGAGYYPLSTNNSEEKNSEIKIFPNPFHNSSTFYFPENTKNLSITLYNTEGKEVEKISNITGTESFIYEKTLPIGNYIYKINSSENTIKTGKLIIQ